MSFSGRYDTAILRDVLHLVEDPLKVLEEVRSALRFGGKVLIRVPNFYDLRMFKNRLNDSRYRLRFTRKSIGAEPFTRASLGRLVRKAGFSGLEFMCEIPKRFLVLNRFSLGLFSRTISSGIYLRAVTR